MAELALPDLAAYRGVLEVDAAEWPVLDGLMHITISRFNRDRSAFAFLRREVLPALAAGREEVVAWSAGCASGEEAYTLAISWRLELAPRFPATTLRILATDIDDAMLARARLACYASGSLKEIPERWRQAALAPSGGLYRLAEPFKQMVSVERHDIRCGPPDGRFDLVMCRNLAFTYFEEDLQRATAARIAAVLRAGGALMLGAHEGLPAGAGGFEPWSSRERVYRRVANAERV